MEHGSQVGWKGPETTELALRSLTVVVYAPSPVMRLIQEVQAQEEHGCRKSQTQTASTSLGGGQGTLILWI